MKKYKILLLLTLLLVTLGCRSGQYYTQNAVGNPETYNSTMLIVNEGIDQVRVYDGIGIGYTVLPSQARCIRLNNPASSQLSFAVFGQHGRWYTPEQSYLSNGGWLWIINSTQAAMSTTRIMESEICQIGEHYGSDHAYYNAYRMYGYSYYSSLTFRPYYVYGYGSDYYVSWNYWNRPQYVFVRYVEQRPTTVAQARPQARQRIAPPGRPSNGESRARRVAPTTSRRIVTPSRTVTPRTQLRPSQPSRITRQPTQVRNTARSYRQPINRSTPRVAPRQAQRAIPQPMPARRITPQRTPTPRRVIKPTTTRRRKP